MEMNALNEQAEELTEYDTPPIEQHLLQLNQRWVGIRSQVANFKPSNGVTPHRNGTASTSLELSPPTKQKYEYAVINKNRKNLTHKVVTVEPVEQSTNNLKQEMSLELPTLEKSTNNNVLFVASPMGDSLASASNPSLSPEEMTVSLASKRYIVETNLDETVDTGSSDLISASQTTAFSDSVSDDEEKLDDYRKLLSRVGILQQQLKTSGIDIDQFAHVNFSSSQELLAVSNLNF